MDLAQRACFSEYPSFRLGDNTVLVQIHVALQQKIVWPRSERTRFSFITATQSLRKRRSSGAALAEQRALG